MNSKLLTLIIISLLSITTVNICSAKYTIHYDSERKYATFTVDKDNLSELPSTMTYLESNGYELIIQTDDYYVYKLTDYIDPTENVEPLISTEIAIILAVFIATIIGILSFWALRKRE